MRYSSVLVLLAACLLKAITYGQERPDCDTGRVIPDLFFSFVFLM